MDCPFIIFSLRMQKEQDCEGSCPCNPGKKEKCKCPKIFRPVCGTNNKTFANDCIRKCEDVVSAYPIYFFLFLMKIK